MSLSEELDRLDELHRRGALSDTEFAAAKARVLGAGGPSPMHSGPLRLNTLRRSRSERWLGGVCGGLAEFTGLAAWAWRALFALSSLCAGTGIAVYILLWIFIPDAGDRLDTPARSTP